MGEETIGSRRHAPPARAASTALVLALVLLVALGAPAAPRIAVDATPSGRAAGPVVAAPAPDPSAASEPVPAAASSLAAAPASSAPTGGSTAPAAAAALAPVEARSAAPVASQPAQSPPAAPAPATASSASAPGPTSSDVSVVSASPSIAAAAPATTTAAQSAPAGATQAAPPARAATLPDPATIDRTSALHPDPARSAQHRGALLRDGLSAGWAMPGAGAGLTTTAAAGAPAPSQPLAAVDASMLPPGAPAEQTIDGQTVAMGGLLPAHRILTYYGHPHDANMGILGEYEKEELLQILRAEAANYEAADPTRPVIPAFEVIATVAQGWPAQDGQFLLDTDMETLVEYADFAEANGILLFLDLQIGRNTVPAEIEKVRSLLERPHVHLALDPEFAIAEGQVPGTHIGELTAEQIGQAQEILAGIVRDNGLPPKILVVHQFREDMILGKERLAPVTGVQLVIESDGFGPPNLKTEVYNILIRDDETGYAGIKHFYRQDVPLMTPAETLALEPAPLLVIYQ